MIICILVGLSIFFLIMVIYAKVSQNPVDIALSKTIKKNRVKKPFSLIVCKELWKLNSYPHIKEQEILSASILLTGLITLTALITFQSILYALIIGVLSFMYLPKIYIKYKLNKLKKDFSQNLGAATSALGTSIRGGKQILLGIEYTALELKPMSELVANEFEKMAEDIKSNGSIEEAALSMARRIDSEEAHIFAESIGLLSYIGSSSENSAKLLQTSANFVNERMFLKERVSATTGYILLGFGACCAIVMLMAVGIYMSSAPFRAFYHTAQARFNLLVFFGFIAFGWWLVYQLKKQAEREI